MLPRKRKYSIALPGKFVNSEAHLSGKVWLHSERSLEIDSHEVAAIQNYVRILNQGTLTARNFSLEGGLIEPSTLSLNDPRNWL